MFVAPRPAPAPVDAPPSHERLHLGKGSTTGRGICQGMGRHCRALGLWLVFPPR